MADPTLADYVLYYTGGGSNSTLSSSIGGAISSVRVPNQSTTGLALVTGVTINDATGNAIGAGTLSYTSSTQTLTWADFGNSSGSMAIPRIFNTPVAGSNIIPFLHSLGGGNSDINIHKWYYLSGNEKILNYTDMISEKILTIRESAFFEKNNIKLIENTNYENLCLLDDMLESVNEIDITKSYEDEIYASKFFEKEIIKKINSKYYVSNKISKKFLLKNINKIGPN